MTRKRIAWLGAALLAAPLALSARGGFETAMGKDVIVVPSLDAPVREGRSTLYCASFQLAWDALRDVVGDDLRLQEPLDLAEKLNRPDRVQPIESAVAIGGLARDGVVERINGAMRDRWGRTAPLIRERPRDPTEIWCCAFLQVQLRFARAFRLAREPLLFRWAGGETPVRAFGVFDLASSGDKTAEQVSVLDRRSDTDFIVSLRTAALDQELILARVPPMDTLGATCAEVLARAERSTPESLRAGDSLAIPLVRLERTHSYGELLGKRLANPGYEEYFFRTAEQDVGLRLDQYGGRVSSRSLIVLTKGNLPRRLELLGPFLLLLQERGAREPYLALWIGDPSPLVLAGR